MHFVILLLVLSIAGLLRCAWFHQPGRWTERWPRTLFFFLLPPLLVLAAAIAIACMGPNGQMIGLKTDGLSYYLVVGWLSLAAIACGRLTIQGWQSLRKIRTDPQLTPPTPLAKGRERRGDLFAKGGEDIRILEIPQLFCAQIGFWQPELVISRGLLQTLSLEHLEAVFAHEQAHYHYRDTFWFFWLGCLRRTTSWLPNTEALWQELLSLRELRADRWASDRVDALLVAEALLAVVCDASGISDTDNFCAAFSHPSSTNRLQERIDALLETTEVAPSSSWWTWGWGVLVFLPLFAVPFHH
jgi:Zn-dependent protease with chaperone function